MKHYGAVDDPKDITTKEYVDAADNALKVKVDALWDFVCTDITSNPFQITFDDLEGLTVRSGIWNTGQRRLDDSVSVINEDTTRFDFAFKLFQ